MRATPKDFPRTGTLRLAYGLYQGLAHLLLAPLLGMFLWRARKEPLYRANMHERFGFAPRIAPGAVWIFAASLGETRAVSPLIDALLAQGQRVLLTHSSPAGLTEGARLFGAEIDAGRVTQAYVPLDLFWAVRLFVHRTRPALGLVVESELWPAMLFEAARARLPMVQVNGNYTARALRRDRARLGGLRLRLFMGFSQVQTKSRAHRARYLATGLPAERIRLVGELKFDQRIDPRQPAAAVRLRAHLRAPWPEARKTLLIASSVENEEPALLGMIRALHRKMPTPPLIVWVPRSPQRFQAVADLLRGVGLPVATRSACLGPDLAGSLPPDCAVLVGDSLGEMNFYYSLADLVFVGASLNDDGGHNIIEPLALGKPVVMGPSIFGITFPAQEAAAAGAFESLPDATALTARIQTLLSEPDTLTAMSAQAAGFCTAHKGAAARALRQLAPFLAPDG